MDWISVTDRLPDNYQEVLIYPEAQFCGDRSTAFYECTEQTLSGKFIVNWEDSYQTYNDEVKPTHWMPYPDPPR